MTIRVSRIVYTVDVSRTSEGTSGSMRLNTYEMRTDGGDGDLVEARVPPGEITLGAPDLANAAAIEAAIRGAEIARRVSDAAEGDPVL